MDIFYGNSVNIPHYDSIANVCLFVSFQDVKFSKKTGQTFVAI
jgi:hypothetical protein